MKILWLLPFFFWLPLFTAASSALPVSLLADAQVAGDVILLSHLLPGNAPLSIQKSAQRISFGATLKHVITGPISAAMVASNLPHHFLPA